MPLPPVLYASFVGPINADTINRIFNGVATATQNGVNLVHLLLQSPGGTIGDGVSIYNLLRAVPFELHVYNTGAIQSIAVLAYLGASHRHTSAHSTFLMHISTLTNTNPNTSAKFRAMTKYLNVEDARVDTLLRTHITMPAKKWRERQIQDLTLTASEAVRYGIAQDIADFVVPSGSQLFNL
jgi:ATP-dependent Clp protease, protease subunit